MLKKTVLHRADSGFLSVTFFLRDLRISPETILFTEWNLRLFLFVCCWVFFFAFCFVHKTNETWDVQHRYEHARVLHTFTQKRDSLLRYGFSKL